MDILKRLGRWNVPPIVLKAGIVLSFLFMLILSFLANYLPLNDLTTKELSDSFDILFVPAPYVFSIWGVIYILLGVFAYWLLKNKQPKLLSVLYILSNLLNALWLVFWHYQQVFMSVIVMLVLLATLLAMYVRVQKIKVEWMSRLPISVYLGWISVATIANISSLLYSISWNGFGISEGIWALLLLAVASILGIALLYKKKDIAYALVLIWAFVGITVKVSEKDSTVGLIALLLAIVLLIDIGITLVQSRKKQ